MKKLTCLLLCLLLMAGLMVPAFAESDVITGEYQYAGSIGFLSNSDSSRSFRYSDDYFSHSGYQYDHELAKMTMDLSSSADASDEVGWAQSNKNFIALIKQCGFTDIDSNYYITNGPTPDSIGVNMASKQLGDYTLLAVAIRGHNYKCEWASDFTVGKDGDHQGFAEARDQVLDYIKEYIAKYGVTGKIKLWLTGYSRSAITANLVGGAIDQGFDFGESVSFDLKDLYCYTFEAPQGTADENCRDEVYYNIHNIINLNDLVPLVSLSAWGHSRFGIDYRLPCRQLDGSYYYKLKRSVDSILQNTDLMSFNGFTLNLIDDFHYISLDPLTTLKKQHVTQIEFYPELLNLITDEIAPTREYFADNAQGDLRVLGAELLGSMREMPEVLQQFGQKVILPENLAALCKALDKGDCKAYMHAVTLVEDLFIQSLAEVAHATFNTEDSKAMVYHLAEGFVKLFIAAPDTMLTLLGNILPILNAHFPEIGRTWLDVTPAEYFLAQSPAGNAEEESHVHAADSSKFHPEQPATCTETGSVEYYECTDPNCTAKLDADGKELFDIVIPIDSEAHSYSTEWSVNDTAHWHAAVCGHDLKADEGNHCDENCDHSCDRCGYTMSECSDQDGDGKCDLCEKTMYSVKLSVKTEVIRSLLLRLPVSCNYKLTPEISGAKVKTVQYSLDGGHIWFYGTSFSLSNQDYAFLVRIYDSTGARTTFTVRHGTQVTKN